MQAAGEQLPGSPDERAYGSAAATLSPPVVPHRVMWPWYLSLAALIAIVALGAWWLSSRQHVAEPRQLPIEHPAAESTPVEQVDTPPADAGAGPDSFAATVAPSAQGGEAGGTARTSAERSRERSAARTRNSDDGNAGRSSFPADEPAIGTLPQTGSAPVVVYRPEVNRGRVVQLGAFPTRQQADAAWRKITRRYPYLATKPKMVNTVDVSAIGGGRPTRMYRLQLGTSSQAQSLVICQQLEKAGQSCVVVY